MSQNPYSQIGSSGTAYGGGAGGGGGGVGGDFIDPMPSRTSVLAIMGLVVAVVGCIGCFIPGPGGVAAMLGGLAIFFIARSSGRLSGLGLAITAIVLGLFQSVAWIAAATGISQAFGQYERLFTGPAGQMMMAIERGDLPLARASLTKEASASVSDDDLLAFKKNYQSSLGAFEQTPQSAWEAVTFVRESIRSAKQKGGGRGPIIQPHGAIPQIPIPAKFKDGSTFLVVSLDPVAMNQSNKQGTTTQLFLNMSIATLDGKEVWLLDPDKAEKLIHGGSNGPPDADNAGHTKPMPSGERPRSGESKPSPQISEPPKPDH